jgi:hypothetical protein
MRAANFDSICVSTQVLKLPYFHFGNLDIWIFRPKKKEYAKLAIPLTGCKGQALRVFEKKSPHLRYATGSIFFQKTLTAAATLLFNLHIFFFFFHFFFFHFRPKKYYCFIMTDKASQRN